jgi:hypothetical protein
MQHLIHAAVLLAMTTSAVIALGDEKDIRECAFEVKTRCVSGEARVTLADGGVVTRVEVNVIWCGQHGRPGYTCSIDSSRGDKDTVWSEDAGATLIANTSPWTPTEPDRVKVTCRGSVSPGTLLPLPNRRTVLPYNLDPAIIQNTIGPRIGLAGDG